MAPRSRKHDRQPGSESPPRGNDVKGTRHGRRIEGNLGIERPSAPSGWRDVMRNDYEYPPELETLSRKERRHAKKDWRRDDHEQRMAWLRDQRQAEPASPISVLVVVLLLAIIVLGIGGGLPKILGTDQAEREPVGLLTPADPVPLPTDAASTSQPVTQNPSPTGGAQTLPPVQTKRPLPAQTASATRVAQNWATLFYSRTPASETYEALITRASDLMTSDMARSFLAQGDPTYDALAAEGGSSKVTNAAVSAPKEGTAPADTTTRISRLVVVNIDVKGKQLRKITVPLIVTMVPQDATWVISDVDGGAGR